MRAGSDVEVVEGDGGVDGEHWAPDGGVRRDAEIESGESTRNV